MAPFKHQSLELNEDKPLVYTAMSKHLFYYRFFISGYVLKQGAVPLNPFMVFDYFLADHVDRDLVREGNNNLVKRADEIWVFGPVSNGVLAEIKIAKSAEKPIRYFGIEKPHRIVPLNEKDVELETDVREYAHRLS